MNKNATLEFFKYWEETRKYPSRTDKEIRQLLEKEIEEDVFTDVLLGNLHMVCQIAFSWRYAAENIGLSLLDLVGAGNIGLIMGLRRYKTSLGHFKLFVKKYIWSYMQKEMFLHTGFSRLEAKKRLRAKMAINITESLSKEIFNEDGESFTIGDLLHHPQDQHVAPMLEVNDLMERMKKATGKVHPLAFSVLEKRYGVYTRRANEPLSLQQTAGELNMSKEGVRKIENRALAYLSSISK